MDYIMKGTKYTQGGGGGVVGKDQCVKANYVSYIKVHVNYLKKFTFIYCQTVLNFTLDISDGLIINRFTQRDEKESRILLKQFTFH